LRRLDPARDMMHAAYWKDDDILEVRLSDKPIAHEASESWHVHKSYATDGELVAVVFFDALLHRTKPKLMTAFDPKRSFGA